MRKLRILLMLKGIDVGHLSTMVHIYNAVVSLREGLQSMLDGRLALAGSRFAQLRFQNQSCFTGSLAQVNARHV